jgi:hypothetical protein
MAAGMMEALHQKEIQAAAARAVEEAIVTLQAAGEATRLPEEAHHRMAGEAIQAEKAVLHPVVAKADPPVVDAARMEEKVPPAAEDRMGFG